MRTVLVTNVMQYTGPGAVEVLLKEGMHVVCHDPSFADRAQRAAFMQAHANTTCLQSATPSAMLVELDSIGLVIDAVVSNDVYPITQAAIGNIALDDFRQTFEAVVMFPVELAQALLPQMKARKQGCFVFVTSARALKPEAGFAVPTSVRAAASAFALALAREVASDNIQVNVVAPNYLYSEMYYPRARFIDDPEGRAQIADLVPMGRLGTPQEVGELIAFLASGRASFVTGQVIYFTGGWP
jgi:3-oxoacyl-[acyl-carrier protein] reductase